MMTKSMVDKGRCESPNLRAPLLPPPKQVSISAWNPSKAQGNEYNDGERPRSRSGSPAAPRNGLQHGSRTPATSSQRWGARNTHQNRGPVEPKGATGTLGRQQPRITEVPRRERGKQHGVLDDRVVYDHHGGLRDGQHGDHQEARQQDHREWWLVESHAHWVDRHRSW